MPCSVAELKQWKALEFCLFALFDGLPCLQHAVLSITLHYTALHFLHSVPISKPCVEEAQVLVDNFVKLLPSLYGIEECTYNSHA